MKEVSLILTYQCNLSCSMCLQRHPYRKNYLDSFPSSMELDDWKNVIEQLEEYRDTIEYVYLTGGEPFLVPYIFDLIKYIKKKHYLVTINSNGMQLLDKIDKLFESRLDVLILSLDGIEDRHDCIRRGDGGFSNVVKVIKEIRSRRKGIAPRIFVNCTIQENNVTQLDGLAAYLNEIGVDQIYFHLQIFISEEMSKKYSEQYLLKLNEVASFQEGSVAKVNMNVAQLEKTIVNLKKKYGNVNFLHDFTKVDLDKYFNFPEKQFRTPGMVKCFAAEHVLEITPDGSVITCHDFPDYIVGNVKEESVHSIWNSEKMNKFRELVNSELFSICHRCCMSERYAGYEQNEYNKKGAFYGNKRSRCGSVEKRSSD